MRIPIIPDVYCSPGMCSDNVQRKTARDGGEAIYGWRIIKGDLYDEHSAHCVWKSPEGQLIDITPSMGEINDNGEAFTLAVIGQTNGHSEFVADPEAQWPDGEYATPSRYVPHDPSNRDVVLACRYLHRSMQAELKLKTAKSKDRAWRELMQWNDKAARHLSRAVGHKITITMTT